MSELPRREGELVRPAVVWWDEDPDPRLMRQTIDLLHDCDLLLVGARKCNGAETHLYDNWIAGSN